VDYSGKYFTVLKHKLKRKENGSYLQFISGSSDTCATLCEKFPFLGRLTTAREEGFVYPELTTGVGVGMIARATEEEALSEFSKQFEATAFSKKYLEFAKKATSSDWKKGLIDRVQTDSDKNQAGFRADSLLGMADNGWFVGTYASCAQYLEDHIKEGRKDFFLNTKENSELEHLAKVVKLIK
jgi:alkanesulfonate monooxygenase SsuD/methylene tetrahydromethanopterin reductase-like flavin-dependent oxidoreductase (luciferase family)